MADEQAQSSTLDYVINDDAQLLEALNDRYDNVEAAQSYGRAGKAIKTRLAEKYPDAINADDDGEHSGWVRCGPFRFKPRNKFRAAEKVEFDRGQGYDWAPFDIERLD